jgi:hypothetical protein
MFEIKESKIQGEGVHATMNIPLDTTVGMATYPYPRREDPFYYLSVMGKKINHSYSPTGKLVKSLTPERYFIYHLVTVKNVAAGEELTVDYNTLQPDFGPAEPHYV